VCEVILEEEKQVIMALRSVQNRTGYGTVKIEIKNREIKIVEVSYTTLFSKGKTCTEEKNIKNDIIKED